MPVKTIADLEQEYMSKQYFLNNRLPENGKFPQTRLMYARMYNHLMPEDKHAMILDLACGPGQFLDYCKGKGYENVTGVDHCGEMVDFARDKVGVRVTQSDALTFLKAAPHNTYSLIVMNDFIEHVDKETGLALVGLAHDCLHKEGRIIIKTGNMAAFGGLTILCNDLTHYVGYTEKSLGTILRLYNFRGIELLPSYNGWKHKAFMKVHKAAYKYIYRGNYPKVVTKIIIATGVK